MASRFPGGVTVRNKKYFDTVNNINGAAPMTEYVEREMVIPILFSDGTAEYATNFKFNSPSVVREAYVRVRVAEAGGTTKTINVGTATADSGLPAAFLNQIDVSTTGLKGRAQGLPIAITPAASTVANVMPASGLLVITGGTLTHITVTRGSVTTADVGTVGPAAVYVSAGDTVKITYSVAPTGFQLFPQVGSDAIQTGAVRVSWTPGSADFTTLAADIVIKYGFIADLTVTPDDFNEIAEQGAGYL